MTAAIPVVFLLGCLVGATAGWLWWYADVRDTGRALVWQAARTAEMRALLVATCDRDGGCTSFGRNCGATMCSARALCRRVAKAVGR